ncbi:MAG: NAD(P)/FAD-dependent oxidoreductase [Pyrinomonadaceae bacterium]
MENYDVVIIGGGLAGLQCARLLGGRGLRALLVDRKASLVESVHTTGIFVRRTLEDFALPDDCLGPPVRHVTLYSPSRRTMMLESPHVEFRVGRMSKLYLRYLEDCERAGVVWMPATRYVGIAPEKHRMIVRLESKEHQHSVATRFLVGADGALSRVAFDLGLDANSEWIVGVEDVWRGVSLEGAPCFHCFLDPVLAPGYLAWVVHDGEETHIGVGGYAARFNAVQALEKFSASLTKIVDLRNAERMERRGGRIPVGGVLRRIACERGLLIGDAAGAVSPLTAGGLDPCLRLSGFAANVIADYLATNDASKLVAYSGKVFRSRFVSRLWMRRLLTSFERSLLLEIAFAVLRLPPFRFIARHVFFGRGSFPDVETASSVALDCVPDIHLIGRT